MDNETIVLGEFLFRSQAEKACAVFEAAGFPRQSLSLVTGEQLPPSGPQAEDARFFATDPDWRVGGKTGAVGGALVGTAVALATLSWFSAHAHPLPTSLILTIAGIVIGSGCLGAILGRGLAGKKSREYEARVNRGDVLLAVRTTADKAPLARQLLRQTGAALPEDQETPP